MQRAFYVTQGSLSIWTKQGDVPGRMAVFADDENGLREFDTYLGQTAEQPCALLIDVIEEEFALDVIPKLGIRDRRALIARRGQRKFRRTPYRISVLQGKAKQTDGSCNVLHSAITNHELVDPWLQVVLRHRVPLSGVYSVPLMVPAVFQKLFDRSTPALFVAPHQGTKLRQVYLRNRHLRSARLSQSPGIHDAEYPQFVVTEAERSRRYLERMRLLSSMEVLDVCVIAGPETAAQIAELGANDSSTQFAFIDPDTAIRKVLGRRISEVDHFETVYLSSIFKRRPKHSYAISGENRYWTLRRIRHAVIAGATGFAAICSVIAAFYFADAWMLMNRVNEIESQHLQLSETFRRENEKFDPIKADSYEMKLAVDTGDYILSNRLPVPWVMNQVGVVLNDYPEMQVRELEWLAEATASQERPPQRRADQPMPVPIPEINEVGAVLTADIVPFDGDMRKAFARIDELAADLQSRTSFSHAVTVEYPLNASPSASVSGEISMTPADFARFRIRVTYEVPDMVAVNGEARDETI